MSLHGTHIVNRNSYRRWSCWACKEIRPKCFLLWEGKEPWAGLIFVPSVSYLSQGKRYNWAISRSRVALVLRPQFISSRAYNYWHQWDPATKNCRIIHSISSMYAYNCIGKARSRMTHPERSKALGARCFVIQVPSLMSANLCPVVIKGTPVYARRVPPV